MGKFLTNLLQGVLAVMIILACTIALLGLFSVIREQVVDEDMDAILSEPDPSPTSWRESLTKRAKKDTWKVGKQTIWVVTDPRTGCEYIVFRTSIIPRLSSDMLIEGCGE